MARRKVRTRKIYTGKRGGKYLKTKSGKRYLSKGSRKTLKRTARKR